MASVVRKRGSQFWFACFRDSNGKQKRRSTRETNRVKALKIAEKYELVARRKLRPQQVRDTLIELYRQAYGAEMPVATVSQFAEQWLKIKRGEMVPRSAIAYENSVSRFLSYLGNDAQFDISLVTKAHVANFRNDLLTKVSPSTVNFHLRVIKGLFKAARREGVIYEDPSEFVGIAKRDNAEGRRAFTLSEIQAVLTVANDEWNSMIRFGFFTGQRLGDIALLTWAKVDLERNELRFVAQKTRKAMLLPIAEPLRRHILSLPVSDDPKAPVHPRAYRTVSQRIGGAGTLSNEFADILAAAGLRVHRSESGKGTGRGSRRARSIVSFHSLRHTAVSFLKDAGIPEAAVMELIGHGSREMSQRYTHVGQEALRKATATLPEL